MNLQGMQNTMYDRLGFGTNLSTDAIVVNRLTRFLNETQREILGMRGLERLRRTVITFSCVAKTPFVAIPQSVTKLVVVMDRLNKWTLDETTLQDLRYNDPALVAQTAYPYEYVVLGLAAPVAQDPSPGGPITATTLGSGGSGYAVNDTGTLTGGNAAATYQVLTVSSTGAVLTYSITAAGNLYIIGSNSATATGGGQPGVGSGLTINITAVTQGVALYAVSSSASDTSQLVYVEGVDANGNYQTASATLTGTSAVQLGTLSTWLYITKFYLSNITLGNITLQDSVPNIFGSIPANRTYARYGRLHLHPTPTQVNVYYADVELHFEDMANAYDEPYLPEDFHWLLPCGALMKEYVKRKDSFSYGVEQARWKEGLGDLKVWVKASTGVARDRRRPRQYSQLGPWFPPGS